jgi:hypothetical protein
VNLTTNAGRERAVARGPEMPRSPTSSSGSFVTSSGGSRAPRPSRPCRAEAQGSSSTRMGTS